MIKIKIIVILIFSLLFAGCSEEMNEEKLARDTFQCFIDDNPRAFKRLYVRQADIEAIIQSSSIPSDMKANAKRQLRTKTAFWRTFSKVEFNHIRFRAFDRGVNWQNTEIIDIKSQETDYGFFEYDRDFNRKYGINVKDIDITFLSDRDTFIMHLDECIKTNHGWCLTEEVRIYRKNY